MKKITAAIIGVGNVGSTIANTLMLSNCVSDIILVDLDQKRCKGELFDLHDALAFSTTSNIIQGTFGDARNADILIISAGKAQKTGQARAELAQENAKIMRSIIKEMKPLRPEQIVIVVTNPVDTMTLIFQQESGLPTHQVIGTGTFLDSQRLKGYLAEKLDIAEQSIDAFVIGEHGDSQFIPWSLATVAGMNITNFNISDKELNEIEQETKNKVYEIIECKGYTNFGIATCVTAICKNIIFNQRRIIPVSYFIEEYGICLSLPLTLGSNGVDQVLPISLNDKEKTKLKASAQKLKELYNLCKS